MENWFSMENKNIKLHLKIIGVKLNPYPLGLKIWKFTFSEKQNDLEQIAKRQIGLFFVVNYN